ncbi:MAG: hypothetical protein JW936_04530 [Sedimentisphaerales bacterium]|nr:hypothetical protein [Sedimentisphaerales bacterium]
MQLLSFDIEISNIFDLKPYEDINKYAPFHISVASTVINEGDQRLWYSTGKDNTPELKMSKETANELLCYLKAMQDDGFMVCAWNGLSFDIQWIGYNADNMKLASEIALKMYDPMFQFFNQRGFPVGLAAVAQAMGIKQAKLMAAENAPRLWHAGKHQEVMDYVLGDSQMTNLIVNEIIKQKKISWVTQKGDRKSEPIPQLKPVEDILKEPPPDQSWMSAPIAREDYYRWFP